MTQLKTRVKPAILGSNCKKNRGGKRSRVRPGISHSAAMKKLLVIVNIVMLTTARFPGELSSSREEEAGAIKDGGASETPWLQFLSPFHSFGQQGLRPKPAAADKIKATKTEYIEVTRRQTVHPMCYTTYENKAPCLPYRSHDEEEPEMDLDVQHQISEGIHTPNEMESFMKPVQEVLDGERGGKYLEFGNRSKTKTLRPRPATANNRETDYVTTTTVLLTKLERYTDHRVTATMVALNCFPVDPAIPKCRRYVVNPIIELPLYGNKKNGHKNPILITPVIKPKSDADEDVEKTVEAVKRAAQAVRAQTGEAQESGDHAATVVPDTE